MEQFYDILNDELSLELVMHIIQRCMLIAVDGADLEVVYPKFRTELMMGKPVFTAEDNFNLLEIIAAHSEYSIENNALSRRVNACVRDILQCYGDRISETNADDEYAIEAIIKEYHAHKIEIDTISPEVSEEVDKVMDMDDSEFSEYLEEDEKKFDEKIDGINKELDEKAEREIEALRAKADSRFGTPTEQDIKDLQNHLHDQELQFARGVMDGTIDPVKFFEDQKTADEYMRDIFPKYKKEIEEQNE